MSAASFKMQFSEIQPNRFEMFGNSWCMKHSGDWARGREATLMIMAKINGQTGRPATSELARTGGHSIKDSAQSGREQADKAGPNTG